MVRTSRRRAGEQRARRFRPARVVALAPAVVVALGLAGLMAPTQGPPSHTEAGIGIPAVVPPLPATRFEAPASQTRLVVRRGTGLAATPAAARSTVLDIPAAAVAAYQRAATVMDASDPACHLPWELLAAVGRVESDHGRHGRSTLDESGRVRPSIFGVRLDGRRSVAAIRDTDAGQLDDDPHWDRAVGPMQFIPSTWSVVGVDADGDGERDPQDIDDAALAAAVYLCAGDGDLTTLADREAAVHSYNHDDAYVALVLRIFESYLAGSSDVFVAMPTGTVMVNALGVPTRSAGMFAGSEGHTAPSQAPGDSNPPPAAGNEPGHGAGGEPSEEPTVEEPITDPPTEPPPTEPPPTEPPPTEPPPTEPPPTEPPPTEEPPAEEPVTCESTDPAVVPEDCEPVSEPTPEGGATTEPEPTAVP